MKMKVSNTTPLQLDWLVAKCEGCVEQGVYGEPTRIDGDLHLYYLGTTLNAAFRPTTDWAQAGPILEREGISTIKLEHVYGVDRKGYTTSKRIPVYGAVVGEYFDTDMQRNSYGESYGEIYYIGTELVTTGPTPLIAAMRCLVASKLGDEVEVPDELGEH